MITTPQESQTGETPSQTGWLRISSFFSSKKATLLNVLGNFLEFTGTGLQIASEITIFVGGLGFFVGPPLKKMYSHLIGKNLYYTLNANADLCIQNLNTSQIPPNITAMIPFDTNQYEKVYPSTLCKSVTENPLITSEIVFNLPYPRGLFTASIVLFGIGCSGLALAYGLIKLGASLHKTNENAIPTQEQVDHAKIMYRYTYLLSTFLLIGSRVAAIYASTTISLTRTLHNLPSVLQNFAIHSSNTFTYNNPDNSTSYPPLFTSITLATDVVTLIDFSELKKAAQQGGEDVAAHDYYIAIAIAAVALVLGYFALKTKQAKERCRNLITQHENNALFFSRITQQNPTVAIEWPNQTATDNKEKQQLGVHSQSNRNLLFTSLESSTTPKPLVDETGVYSALNQV